MPPFDLPILSFPSAEALEAYLDREHTTAPGFHLQLAKKGSPTPSVSAADAVEVALCFGWIDGRANALDEHSWLVRYTPRRAKSIWSLKNVGTVERLLREGRMRPAGIAAVEAAKADGRWERAYAGPATMTVPDDFAAALAAAEETGAAQFWEGLSRSRRYAVLMKLHTGSVQTRPKRIEEFVRVLGEGRVPGERLVKTSMIVKKVERRKNVGKKDSNAEKEARPSRRAGLRQRK
ncbi:hypothetical protein BGW36DRAFT_357905 [Talaromyces proteolyticus]|uniref:Bacteriocin-protection protein, YdeI/OmpD-associated family n=1 Tax=Talaromyces proteolyticus TaxID=1131652 RepID=A0AAD4KT70_9EURO|nr:uncharacterized protein BGW36DRAFT_357905 [Talaromyces proteolyticus]KAH8698365.1 hypothetical protein BGW36DRAFT_357905 [Talaromyces proteolyticus]